MHLPLSVRTLVNGNLTFILALAIAMLAMSNRDTIGADDFRKIKLQGTPPQVEPMTGLVLWSTNENVSIAPIQLEFEYIAYSDVILGEKSYDFSVIDRKLEAIASRKHQAILRFYDTYVGKESGVPKYIRDMPGYNGVTARSEGKRTGFPDWSHPAWQACVLDFFEAFGNRYDRDARIAYLQVGFGLWSEYHIYDGPMKLGKTFPSKEYQTTFLIHLSKCFQETQWMISVDAADSERTPIEGSTELKALRFGLFDDSLNHKKHAEENEPNWRILGLDRWKRSPTGGEFSFFEKSDQSKALSPSGPHGVSCEAQVAKFHVSFVIGDDQPRFQKPERLRSAGMSMGYRFRVQNIETNGKLVRGEVENVGVAPIYYDAYPSWNGKDSEQSLRGLLPGERIKFEIASSEQTGSLAITCKRLVNGQTIGFEVDQ
ncbi:MAG: DUF4832 domain-containing protein [Pirellula sp.]|jgi:hypothetical protein